MNSRRERRFDEALAALPPHARIQAEAAYRLFAQNPFHTSLKFKPVTKSRNIWSVRVGISYRALGRRDGDTIAWFWIGTHAEYNQLLRRR